MSFVCEEVLVLVVSFWSGNTHTLISGRTTGVSNITWWITTSRSQQTRPRWKHPYSCRGSRATDRVLYKRWVDLNSDKPVPSHTYWHSPDTPLPPKLSVFQGTPLSGIPWTQISLFWFHKLGHVIPNHSVTANIDETPEEVRWESDACSKSTSRSSRSY